MINFNIELGNTVHVSRSYRLMERLFLDRNRSEVVINDVFTRNHPTIFNFSNFPKRISDPVLVREELISLYLFVYDRKKEEKGGKNETTCGDNGFTIVVRTRSNVTIETGKLAQRINTGFFRTRNFRAIRTLLECTSVDTGSGRYCNRNRAVF